MIVQDDRPYTVAYAIAHGPPRTLQGDGVRQRVLAYLDVMTDPQNMSPETHAFLDDTAEMFFGSLEPVVTRLDAFAMAYTMHAQANRLKI